MNKQEFILYHLPAILYGALIVAVSSIPQLRTPDIGVEFSDKVLHACEYAVFGWLFYRSFSRARFSGNGFKPLVLTLVFLLVFAAGDEYHQNFVRGRSMDIFDFLADILGGALVVILLKYRHQQKHDGADAHPDDPTKTTS